MRSSLKLAMGVCVVAAIGYAATASAEPYFHRHDNGSWINTEYNDGTCRYSFSYDTYDGERHVNRNGDCSHVVIGPQGEAILAAPAVGIAVPSTTGVAIPDDED